jgi:hypothetical protein
LTRSPAGSISKVTFERRSADALARNSWSSPNAATNSGVIVCHE